MVLLQDFQKFHSIISELDESRIQYKLFGKMEEAFSGAFVGTSKPKNNILHIKVVALTTIGSIFCNSTIKLTESNTIQITKQLFGQLPISFANVSYNKDSGNVTIA